MSGFDTDPEMEIIFMPSEGDTIADDEIGDDETNDDTSQADEEIE